MASGSVDSKVARPPRGSTACSSRPMPGAKRSAAACWSGSVRSAGTFTASENGEPASAPASVTTRSMPSVTPAASRRARAAATAGAPALKPTTVVSALRSVLRASAGEAFWSSPNCCETSSSCSSSTSDACGQVSDSGARLPRSPSKLMSCTLSVEGSSGPRRTGYFQMAANPVGCWPGLCCMKALSSPPLQE